MRTRFEDILLTVLGVLLGIAIVWWEFASSLADQLWPAVVQASLILGLFSALFTLVCHRKHLLFITAVIPTFVPLWLALFVKSDGLLQVAAVAHISAIAVGGTLGFFSSRYVTRNRA